METNMDLIIDIDEKPGLSIVTVMTDDREVIVCQFRLLGNGGVDSHAHDMIYHMVKQAYESGQSQAKSQIRKALGC